MPRPKSLQLDDIAATALAILDRDGLPALSMRSVAQELGVGTMSLYRYVADRVHLERLLVELVLSAVDPGVPASGSWQKRVGVLLVRARAAALAHPAVTPLLLVHRQSSERSIRWGEALLGLLTAAGFRGNRRVIAFRSLLSYFFGALQLQSLGPLAGPGTEQLARLPASQYPLLSETARDARRISPDEEFQLGLDLLLRGLERSSK